jgi:hypothetical protein
VLANFYETVQTQIGSVPGVISFATVGMHLELGRDFNERDTEKAPPVATVNESFARQYFADENPVGKRFGASTAASPSSASNPSNSNWTSRWCRNY